MTEKTASVHWQGQGKQDQISTETSALKTYRYGFGGRFEDDWRGTSAEELLGAAHAACFNLAFSLACEKAGFATEMIDAHVRVRLVALDNSFVIDRIALTMTAVIPGLNEARFQEIAKAAKHACPLSRALASVPEIMLQARLENPP